MTRLFGILAVTLLLAPSAARADDLTLRDVIELHRTGLGDDLLIAVIDADGGSFQLSFADIQDLKSDGLSERVIEALVRTGSRRAELVEVVTPVVQVTQEVITYVPSVIVVGTDVHHRHHPSPETGAPDGESRRHGRPRREKTPPAAWVTRQEDGKNVSASGRDVSSRPSAAWVTPRDAKPIEAADAEAPTPKPR